MERSKRLAIAGSVVVVLFGAFVVERASVIPERHGAAAPVTQEPVHQAAVTQSSQLIVVSLDDESSTVGTLTAYQRNGSAWQPVLGPMRADVGELGVGVSDDDSSRTPVGTFPLGQAFGRELNPGTLMPYFQADDQDWWDEDPESPTYNMHVRGSEISTSAAENLYDSGFVYDYSVLIEHNPERIPGRSSGIFLHVSNGDPTAGCVTIGREEMRSVLTWLDPAASPLITIGVGATAP